MKKIIENLVNPKLKYEEEGNVLMVDPVKLWMNSLYGQSIRKDIDDQYCIRSEKWFKKNYDRAVDYEPIASG